MPETYGRAAGQSPPEKAAVGIQFQCRCHVPHARHGTEEALQLVRIQGCQQLRRVGAALGGVQVPPLQMDTRNVCPPTGKRGVAFLRRRLADAPDGFTERCRLRRCQRRKNRCHAGGKVACQHPLQHGTVGGAEIPACPAMGVYIHQSRQDSPPADVQYGTVRQFFPARGDAARDLRNASALKEQITAKESARGGIIYSSVCNQQHK